MSNELFCRFDKRDLRREFCLAHRCWHPEHQVYEPHSLVYDDKRKKHDVRVIEQREIPPATLQLFNRHVELFQGWQAAVKHGKDELAQRLAGESEEIFKILLGKRQPVSAPVGVRLAQ